MSTGLDDLLNKVLMVTVEIRPDIFVNILEACFKEGIFVTHWKKKQKLVLLPTPNKLPRDPALYSRNSLLDRIGRTMERVIWNRLLSNWTAGEGFNVHTLW